MGDGCFLATGAALFPGSVVGTCTEVRIHGVVHVNTVLPSGEVAPIGWVAVGDPARIFPPGQHEQIWAIQDALDFPGHRLRRCPGHDCHGADVAAGRLVCLPPR